MGDESFNFKKGFMSFGLIFIFLNEYVGTLLIKSTATVIVNIGTK